MATKTINTDMPEFIGNWSMNRLIDQLEEVEADAKILDWFSYGGSVLAGWKLADYLNSGDTRITAKVTGLAASMGAALLPYFFQVEGSKQSFVMLHAPVGGGEKVLDKVAKDLTEALSAKIDDAKLEDITGVTVSEMMAQRGEDRKDYWLTGQQAFDIGLYDKLIDVAPQEIQALSKEDLAKASIDLGYSLPEALIINTPTAGANEDAENNNNKVLTMDLNKLKTEHPAVYAQVLAEGVSNGVKQEKDRVSAYLVFADVDPETVKNGINSGEIMNQATQLELLRKANSIDALKAVEDNQGEDVVTDKVDMGKDNEAEDLEAALSELNIGTSKTA